MEEDKGFRFSIVSQLESDKFIEKYKPAFFTVEKFHEDYSLAHNNVVEAQYCMGVFYKNGYVVKEDYKKAAEWFTKAAQQNHVEAQYNLGFLYIVGFYERRPYIRIKEDYKAAFDWFFKAAQQNYAPAQHNIGLLYGKGGGVEKDYEKAE
ncbi:MAG: sel1 repeat family protein [Alphaproteobacteria bacterium]|nr:sel1 repeat family protein [Alphaproteobacteria bacterium]